MMLAKQWLMIGSISAFFAVVFGAFGGHVLKNTLSEKYFSIYLIAVQYQTYHSIALILLGLFAHQYGAIDTTLPGWAFTLGIVTFSGSLYALSLTQLDFLGMITPIGGIAFLAGWFGFALSAWKI